MQRRLREELNHVANRMRWLRIWQGLGVAWLCTAVVIALLAGIRPAIGAPSFWTAFVLVFGALASCLGVWIATRKVGDPVALARRIETAFPELKASLLAAVEQNPDPHSGRFGYLQSHVIQEALDHARRTPWADIIPRRRIALDGFAAFVVLSIAASFFAFFPQAMSRSMAAANASAIADQLAAPGSPFSITVEPGNTEVERGTSLLVLARIAGAMPSESSLVWTTANGENTKLAMSRSLNDPVFGGRIPAVNEPGDYHVEIADQITPIYHVDVFEYPRLERADAKLVYPKYTGLEERLVQDIRTVSVVEGTELTLTCLLNKPVAKSRLLEEDHDAIELTAIPGDKPAVGATIHCDRTRKLRLELVDDRGRKNTQVATITINVLPNLPVAIKPVFPARDLEASPLEELDLKATVWDDFGVAKYGLTYSLGGDTPIDVTLGEKAAAKSKHELAQAIRLEDLKAEPDQLLSYHWWAEDLDDQGQPRRTESDMYFAEIRPFEEIFRQGEQQAGGQQQQRQQRQGQGQGEQAAQKMAELQKQIINATWKVTRREISDKLTDDFEKDAEELLTSQETVRELAEEMSSQLEDAESLEHLQAIQTAVDKAIQHLSEAKDAGSRDPLPKALSAEQAAYQAMLKLRAREHRVTRQQNQQGQASAGRSQQQRQQMEQLDLKNERNPYEEQRTAQEQQDSPEDRENRQVLNRLRELARRQHDVNERLKEMQTALQEAKTEAEKEELRHQLKRLEEEQQQLLRDTEELQSRMEAPENQERMSEQREQLEQARDQARRSSEALNQEMVSQAAAAGTRAEKQFEELRDEFRRRASNRFTEEMKAMRDSARDLEQREQQLAESLKGSSATSQEKPKTLEEKAPSEDTPKQMAEQRRRLTELDQAMRQTIEQAEQTEPLLSERLYDTARNLLEQNPDRALEAAENSMRRGLADDARQQEQAAGRAITKLREGVERAAEAVLGDETEALRRAREELQQLSKELEDEIARNNPDRAAAQEQTARQDGQPQPGENPSGEPRSANDGVTPQEQSANSDGQQPAESGDSPRGEQNRGGATPPAPLGEQQRPGGERQGQDGQQPGSRPGDQQGQRPEGRQPSERNQPGRGQQSSQPPQEGSQPQEASQSGDQSSEQESNQATDQQGAESEGQQPGEQSGQQPGGQRGQQGQQGQRPSGQPQRGGQQAGNQGGRQRDGQPGQRERGQQQRGTPSLSSQEGAGIPGGGQPEYAPLTGRDFTNWSDRLRDVEEIVDDPELRAQASRIRDRARAIRAEFKRHSEPPKWDLIETEVAGPLLELRDRVSDELLRRSSKRAVVPLDRDPVPPAWAQKTRDYYERLGKGQ